MYPLFVTKGLIDPSERVSRKDAGFFVSVL
jgi:hypothetical protein